MKGLAIVILNYNGRDYLKQFLPSVIRYSGNAKIIVADNASSDDSVELVTQHFPSVEVLRLENNLGYSGGYDHILRRIDAEIFCLLNSDVEVTEGWLEPVMNLFDTSDDIAAIQPKILSFREKDTFEYAGAGGGFIDKYGFPFCRGRIFETFEKDTGQYNDECEVFWASGACMFIRAGDFRASGGLDTDFFAHMEEIDLCWRLHGMGRKVWYTGKSTVYHVGGGTLSKSNPKKTYLNFRNGLSLLYKNCPASYRKRRMFIRSIFDFVAVLRFFLLLQGQHAFAVLRAHRDFWAAFSVQRKKRRDTQTLMRISNIQTIYQGSVVWQYFVSGRKVFQKLPFSEPSDQQTAH